MARSDSAGLSRRRIKAANSPPSAAFGASAIFGGSLPGAQAGGWGAPISPATSPLEYPPAGTQTGIGRDILVDDGRAPPKAGDVS
jgi:hypothetical protein